jgi:hypothetical protein
MRLERSIALAVALVTGCCVNPFRNTDQANNDYGRPPTQDEAESRLIQPAQPAVQSPGQAADPGAGFDIRLVRVQPGLHVNTVQRCNVVFANRPEAVDTRASHLYAADVAQRMTIRCHAPTGDGWADLIFTAAQAARVGQVEPGARLRIRIQTPDGGFFGYPIVQFESVEGRDASLLSIAPRAGPATLTNGFDLRGLADDPSLVGTTQQCSIAFADEIDLVDINERRRRSYPAGIQNRMTVHCKHGSGEEPADLVFMPAQALAALNVRRGEVIPVRVIARNGGSGDYPIVQYSGP